MTDAMRAAWRRDGFLVVDGFKSADACKALMDRARTIIDSYDETDGKTIFETDRQTHSGDDYFRTSGDKVRLFFEEGAVDHEGRLLVDRHQAVNKIGHAMHDLDPVFSEFSRDPRMEALARDAGQVDPGLIQSMIIYKPPRIGGEVHCHQDATFLHTTPQSCVGFWFALEDATLENGCLQAVAGAHFAPLTSRFRYIDGDLVTEQIGPPLWNDADAVPLEAPTGTLVMLHGQLPHFSGPNRSDKARRAYAVHTIDRTAKWSPDNWLRRAPDMPVRGFS
ncbi:MAG: phytanoyl-CoA dioxygenase family protein [Rhodobiaceae bacterium]|nr:phytanoyl-CoA dioxygenase family protein [Rhodobiaceae bacterium]